MNLSLFNNIISNKTIKLINANFLRDLQWSSFGIVSASLLLFLVHALSGRVLGPEQYGIASFIILAANTLRTSFVGGSDMSLIKDLARIGNDGKEKKITAAMYTMFLSMGVFLIGTILIFYFFRHQFNQQHTYAILMTVSLLVLFAIKFFFEAIARGLSRFKIQAIFRFAEAIVVLCAFPILFFYIHVESYISFVFALICGSVFSIFLYIWKFGLYVHFHPSTWRDVRDILSSGILFSISTLIASFVLLSDRFMIGTYVGKELLGVYSAYALVSVTAAGLITTIVSNVLFVHVAQHSDTMRVIIKTDRMAMAVFPISFFSLGILSSMAIMFFGDRYGFNITYIILFSLFGSLSIIVSLYSPIITTYSNHIYRRTLMIFSYRIIVFIGYYLFLAYSGWVTIGAIISGLIIDSIFTLIIARLVIRKYIEKSFCLR